MLQSDVLKLHIPRLFWVLLIAAASLLVLASAGAVVRGAPARQVAACVPTPNTINGLVFQDYNGDGTRGALEPGVAGIVVTAYYTGGSLSTVTGVSGTYSLNIPDGTNARVEFTNLPAGFFSGPHGPDSDTTVTFATSPNCNVSLGINRPSQYYGADPTLVTSEYAFGNQLTKTIPVLVSFPYSAGGTSTTLTYDSPPPTTEANSDQIGTTWGLAYQESSNSIFAAAFMKRHAGFGPGGTGAIYRINRNLPLTGPGRATVFVDLNALFGANTAGANPHDAMADPTFAFDSGSFDQVGKIALGDLDISEDGQTLWTINLADRQLYKVPVGNPPAPPTAGQISRYPLPRPTDCVDADNNMRPFATAVHDGLVYVGMVCSAQTAPIATNLRAYVYAFDPNNPNFSQVLDFALDYPRLCADRDSDNMPTGTWNKNCSTKNGPPFFDYADWQPWISSFQTGDFDSGGFGTHPQPMLTDIVFDHGDMILGLRDRFGDQVGFQSRNTDPTDPQNYLAITAGDILRACANGSGGWTLENNATCGGVTTAGADLHQGPGNGEYYFEEHHPFHDEDSIGGLVQVPGLPNVAETAFDPIHDPINGVLQLFDGGVLWFDNTTAGRIKSYRIYDASPVSDPPPPRFGKANGLGDLEALSIPGPIEIGNRVWLDSNNNGIQDAGETPIAGVTVHLYLNGVLVATTTTNAQGEYYFTGLLPNTPYTVALDNPADYTVGALQNLTLTLPFQGGVLNDSNGTLGANGFPQTTVTTGTPGDNNHTLDFGFVTGPTAIELLYFRADGVSGRQVRLKWATAVEIDNFGFNLYRANTNDLAQAKLIHFEPSAIQGWQSGATYVYTDTAPSEGVWWYWLTDVDTRGNETHDAQVMVGVGLNALLPYHVYLPAVFKQVTPEARP